MLDQLHHLLECESFLQLVYMLRKEVDHKYDQLASPVNSRDDDMYFKGQLRGMLFYQELLEKSINVANKEMEDESAE